MIADQLYAVAEVLVAAFPESAEALNLRASAHCQFAKNGWTDKDYKTIENRYKLAIQDLQIVIAIDPEYRRPGNELHFLYSRLAEFQREFKEQLATR